MEAPLLVAAVAPRVRLPALFRAVYPLYFLAKTRYTKGMKDQKTTLAQRVADHYDDCLGCNGAWCNFTNELGVLNLLGCLEDCNYEFVAELMIENTEEFEDEDFDEMVEAIGEYLADKKVPADCVFAGDLERAQFETGFDPEEVAGLARDAGVPEEEVAEYLADAA